MAVFRAGEVESIEKQAIQKALDSANEIAARQFSSRGGAESQPSVTTDEELPSSVAPGASPGLSTTPTLQGLCAFCGFAIEGGKPMVIWHHKTWHMRCAWAMLDD